MKLTPIAKRETKRARRQRRARERSEGIAQRDSSGRQVRPDEERTA